MIATLLALCLALPSIVEASETTDKQVYRPFKKRLRRSSLTSKLAKESEAALQRSVRVFQQRYLIKRHRLELLAGGGMRTGQVIGATNRFGEYAQQRPVHFREVFATLYHQLGLDLQQAISTATGVSLTITASPSTE